MGPIACVAGVCAVGLAWQFWQWRRGRGSCQFVLGILPTALLLLTVSIPFTVWMLLQTFNEIARRGTGGLAVVAPFCIGIDRALWFGSVLFLLVMGTAGLLQAWARADQREAEPNRDARSAGSRWLRGIVVASTLSVAPVAVLSHLTWDIPSLVMRAGGLAADGHLTPEVSQQTSATLATQIVAVVVAGVALSSCLMVFAIANLLATRSRTALDALDTYSWVVLVGFGIWVGWGCLRLSADLKAFHAAMP